MSLLQTFFSNFKWKKFKYHFLLNMNDPRNMFRYSGIDMMKVEQERQLKQYKFRIHPHSRFRICWDTFYCFYICINIVFTYAILCLSMVFVSSSSMHFFFVPFADIILLLNIIINFITGIFQEGRREANMSLVVISKHYLSTSLLVFDVVGLFWGSQLIFHLSMEPSEKHKVDSLFLSNAIAVLCRSFSGWNYWRNSVSPYFMIEGFSRELVELFAFFPLVLSFLACLVFAVKHSVPHNNPWELLTDYLDILLRVYSSYANLKITINLTTIILDALVIIFPYIINFLITSFLIILWWSKRGSSARYHDLIDNFYCYLQQVEISDRLRIRIGKYYEETYQGQYYSEPYILEKISSELREDILAFKLSTLREQIMVFRMIPLNELLLVSQYLVCEVFFGNDVIAYSGSPHDRMYFIARGTIAVYTNNAYEIYHIPHSMFFLVGSLRPEPKQLKFNYLACETTILYALSRLDFLPIMRACPVFTQLLSFAFEYLAGTIEILNNKDIELNS